MLKLLRLTCRLIYIGYILARYRIDALILRAHRLAPLRFLIYLNPWHYFSRKHTINRGERLKQAFEHLGPIFVKFGQLLSTRQDLLPKDIAQELACLQDHVKPFPSQQAKVMIETNLQCAISEVFQHFEDEALASASIAQVHQAQLHNGDDVVIKMLRPQVEKRIARDIELLKVLIKLARQIIPRTRKMRLSAVVEEFELSLKSEIDLLQEAANLSLFSRNFAKSPLVYFPQVYWPYCYQNMLVMEQIDGLPINNTDELQMQGTNLKRLAAHAIDIFFTQVFDHNFFHADMHPGNIFVSRKHRQQFNLVDCGIVGSLSEQDRRYIAENLLAFFNRDYARVVELHIECGWVAHDINPYQLESAIRATSEPIFEKPLKDISMGSVMMHLIHIARKFDIRIQPQLLLLQKTLFNIEALGRQLDPDLDLWKTAKPYLEKWLSQQIGIRGFFRKARQQAPRTLEMLPELPAKIGRFLEQGQQQTNAKQMLQPNASSQDNHSSTPSNESNQQPSYITHRSLWVGLGAGCLAAVGIDAWITSDIHQQTALLSLAGIFAFIALLDR